MVKSNYVLPPLYFCQMGSGWWSVSCRCQQMGLGLVELWQEVRSGSGSELIVSLQMYSKGQNSPRYLETQGKGGSNSTSNERSKQMSCTHPRRAPVEGIGECREKEQNQSTLFSEGFAWAMMGSLLYFLVPGPQTLQEGLPVITLADWKFTFCPSILKIDLVWKRHTQCWGNAHQLSAHIKK